MTREQAQAALASALDRGMPDFGLMDLWLHCGADIDTRMKNGDTPLMRAAQCNYISFVDFLLARGADVNAVNPLDGRTPLMQPAWIGHVEIVERLLTAGADPEARTFAGQHVFSRMKPGNPLGPRLRQAIETRRALAARAEAEKRSKQMQKRLDGKQRKTGKAYRLPK